MNDTSSKRYFGAQFNLYSILISIGFILFGLAIGFLGGLLIGPTLLLRKSNDLTLSGKELSRLDTNLIDSIKTKDFSTVLEETQLKYNVLKLNLKRYVAQQQPIGIERTANQVIISDQTNVAITALSNGGFAEVWVSNGQIPGLSKGIVGGIFSEAAEAISPNDILVSKNATNIVSTGWNDTPNNGEYLPDISIIGDSISIVWLQPYVRGLAQQVIAKTLDNSGNILAEESIVSSYIPSVVRQQPYIASLTNKSFVAWTEIGHITQGYPNAYGQFVNNSNLALLTSNEIRLDSGNAPPANAVVTSLISLKAGPLVAWFIQNQPGGPGNLFCVAQQLDISGSAINAPFLLQNNTQPATVNAKLASLQTSNTAFLVVIDTSLSPGTGLGWGVFARFFDSPGNPSGNQTESRISTFISQNPTNPNIIVLNDDSAIAVYQLFGPDDSDNGIFAQWFRKSNDGSVELIGREFLVNWLNTYGNQQNPKIIKLNNGNIVISYECYSPGVDSVSGLPLGFDIKHQVLMPRLDPFVYNADIPLTLDQNTPQNGTSFVLNPMVDADTVTVTLTPSAGINLSTENTSSYSYGNATVIKDADTGEISISGHAVPVNLALNQLIIAPTNYFSGNASIAIHATDGGLHADFNATVSVDVVPVAYKPNLTTATQIEIYQNTPFTLTLNLFNASNPDSAVHRPIVYEVGSALHITFFNTTTTPATQVISFSDEELSDGLIEANPDDSGLMPSFTLQARDRITSLTSDVTPLTVAFTARPVLELGAFAVNSDEVFTFTTDNLKANDGVYPVNSVWQFSAIQNAQIINPKSNTKWPVYENGSVTVTQDALVNGLVGIKPNGKSTSPAFNVAFGIPTNVPGQNLYSRTSAAQINFNYVAKDNKALIGGVVGGVGGLIALSALGVGIFACVRKNKKEQALLDAQEASRQNEPLANAVWEKLGSPEEYADFTSEMGLAFVAAINKIAAKMNQQLSYKDNYIYFAEKFVEAMNQHQITADHISDSVPKISSYINKNWDEAKAVQVQEQSMYDEKNSVELSAV